MYRVRSQPVPSKAPDPALPSVIGSLTPMKLPLNRFKKKLWFYNKFKKIPVDLDNILMIKEL
jgi:hypothetical protein